MLIKQSPGGTATGKIKSPRGNLYEESIICSVSSKPEKKSARAKKPHVEKTKETKGADGGDKCGKEEYFGKGGN